MRQVRFRTALQRKDPRLPVFIRVPGEAVAPLEAWQLGHCDGPAEWPSIWPAHSQGLGEGQP